MVSAEHGGNSSSPNGKIITGIVQGAAGSVEIRFSDGSSFFVRPQDTRYAVGDRVTDEDTEYLSAMSEVPRVKSKAVDILALRDHSVFQLKQKLLKRGFSAPAVDTVLTELAGSGYLDDRRFAERWIEERLRKHPESQAFLVRGLMERGIRRDLAGEAVDEFVDEETEQTAFEQAAAKIMRKSGITAAKFVRAMAARGFHSSQILRFRDQKFAKEREI